MQNTKYECFIEIIDLENKISQKVIGQEATEAKKLFFSLILTDLKEKDFKIIESFISILLSNIDNFYSEAEEDHIQKILNYVRNE